MSRGNIASHFKRSFIMNRWQKGQETRIRNRNIKNNQIADQALKNTQTERIMDRLSYDDFSDSLKARLTAELIQQEFLSQAHKHIGIIKKSDIKRWDKQRTVTLICKPWQFGNPPRAVKEKE